MPVGAVSLSLQLITERHEDQQQVSRSARDRKVEVGIGQSRTPTNTALLDEVIDERALAAASWRDEGEDGQERPGLVAITTADEVEEGDLLLPVHERFFHPL